MCASMNCDVREIHTRSIKATAFAIFSASPFFQPLTICVERSDLFFINKVSMLNMTVHKSFKYPFPPPRFGGAPVRPLSETVRGRGVLLSGRRAGEGVGALLALPALQCSLTSESPIMCWPVCTGS